MKAYVHLWSRLQSEAHSRRWLGRWLTLGLAVLMAFVFWFWMFGEVKP